MTPRPRATSDADILSATYRIVSRLGPTLTLADIAKEAGISPATLVQRFGSKRSLLLALAASGWRGLPEKFARIRAAHRSALAAIAGVGDCIASMAESPEALSNSLAFVQMDLVDPEFQQHALACSGGPFIATRTSGSSASWRSQARIANMNYALQRSGIRQGGRSSGSTTQ